MRIVHPEDRPMAMELWREAMKTGLFECEYRLRRHDGEYRWFVNRTVLSLDSGGRIVQALSTATDIHDLKLAEEGLRESESRVRHKLDSILTPEADLGDLELADIIDSKAIQAIMDSFYKLARLPMAIIDLKGRMLVGAGWQQTSTQFHRAHPETCAHCLESDLQLTTGLAAGESRLYKCKNNMWDMATPILIGGEHVGNLFTGQFFFDDEQVDYDFFRAQARQYGFNEEEYIAALDLVPRLSREFVDEGMRFLIRLPGLLSKLSYANVKLAKSLAERDSLMESLQATEERQREFYRRAILAATEGKLLISERVEIETLVGKSVASWNIREFADVATVRDAIADLAAQAGMPQARVYNFLGCVVEAAGNAVKHTGGGKASLHRRKGKLVFVVSDSGHGIGAMDLPDVALTRGYSTAGTLGMGYKVMIHFADKVYLATGPDGTTVANEMDIRAGNDQPDSRVPQWLSPV